MARLKNTSGMKPVVGLYPAPGGIVVVLVRSGPSRRAFRLSEEVALAWHRDLVARGWDTTTPPPRPRSESELLGERLASGLLMTHAARNPELWAWKDGRPHHFTGSFSGKPLPSEAL